MPDTPEQRLLSVYNGFYAAELDRREKLNARFSVLAVIYSVVIGAMAACLAGLPRDLGDARTVLLLAALSLEGLSLLVSTYFAIRFLIVEKYAYVMPAGEIRRYFQKFDEFNDVSPTESGRDMNDEITAFLTDQFVTAATINFDENNVRLGTYSNALRWLMAAVVIALLSGIPYLLIKYGSDRDLLKDVQKVEITNLPKR